MKDIVLLSFPEVDLVKSMERDSADALQAVSIGEGILIGMQYIKEKQSAAKKPSKQHQKLYRIFNEWATSQPKNHGFKSTEDAVNVGFVQYLRDQNDNHSSDVSNPQELLNLIGTTTHRRLKANLEKYCSNEKPYPFPRPRSKKKA